MFKVFETGRETTAGEANMRIIEETKQNKCQRLLIQVRLAESRCLISLTIIHKLFIRGRKLLSVFLNDQPNIK